MVVDYDVFGFQSASMETIAISVFKATCLEVLRRVSETGETILVTRGGTPVAQVAPPPPVIDRASWLGSARGTGEILGDIVSPLDVVQDTPDDP